jgi:hypothetical protein
VHAVLHLAEQVVELRKQLHDDMTDLKGSIDRHR